MDVTQTNSINPDNDFAKDFLQISRKVTLGLRVASDGLNKET